MAFVALTHNDVVKTKMAELANVTTQAAARITPSILSNSAREIQENLDADVYEDYMTEFESLLETHAETPPTENWQQYPITDAKSFEILTDAEKSMRNLIYAEAYFGLYHLAIALKKLVKGSVNVNRESAGSANVYASPFDEIVANTDNYREQAYNCISFATGGNAVDDDLFADGSLGVFVV